MMATSPPKTGKTLVHLPALDGLRGMAALAVFIPHFFNCWNADGGAGFNPFLQVIYNNRGYGGFGVDVFFVLSGFLISSLLIADRTSPSFFYDFYWKRVLRILPVYLVHLLATALLFSHWQGYVLLCLVFLVNFADPLHVKVVGPAWTLSIEEQFYLLWPQAVRHLKPKTLYYLAFGLVLSANALRVLVPLWHGGADIEFTFYRTDGLALGALVAFQRFLPVEDNRMTKGLLRFLGSNLTLVITLVLASLLISYDSNSRMVPELKFAAANLLFYRVVKFIVFYRGKGLGWLASPIAVYMGSVSYAFYMYHTMIILTLDKHLGHIPASHGAAILLRIVVALGIALAASTVSRYVLELPAQRLRRYILNRPQAPAEFAPANASTPVAL
jgi:peptidoglycan/LPS O-acetylase OafA/YrhL